MCLLCLVMSLCLVFVNALVSTFNHLRLNLYTFSQVGLSYSPPEVTNGCLMHTIYCPIYIHDLLRLNKTPVSST